MQLQEQQLCGFWFLGIGLAKEGESGQSVLWCRNSKTHELYWCGVQTSCPSHYITKLAHRIRSLSRPV